jgi:hypothetical protein
MKAILPAALLLTFQAVAGEATDPPPARRFALVVGANRGAADRVPLRYAVADAERFTEVVTQMGGVLPADSIVLHEPNRQALREGLQRTALLAAGARREGSRVEVLVYFSGHADEQGLMLGREILPYRELRSAVDAMGADVGITILDACASGAITRLKGGRTHPAFLTEAAAGAVKGYAFLTSSSEDETAQESERLRGSFFTHALLSGLRGAADVTGDGRVTLNEAYQFAFQETLAQTTTTDGGAQHPSYDIKMAGTGEVVMTDLRQTSSTLILGEDYEGRFFVLGSQRRLVAELYKPAGRKVELGLDAGEYELVYEQDRRRLTATVKLEEGQHTELLRSQLREAPRQATRRRGNGGVPEPEEDPFHGRLRAQAGMMDDGDGSRFTALHWATPTLAVEAGLGTGVFSRGGSDVVAGVRYYPPLGSRFRPFVGLALGRLEVTEYLQTALTSRGQTFNTAFDHGVLGGEAKLGLDVLLNRRISVYLDGRFSYAHGNGAFTSSWGLGWGFGGPARD